MCGAWKGESEPMETAEAQETFQRHVPYEGAAETAGADRAYDAATTMNGEPEPDPEMAVSDAEAEARAAEAAADAAEAEVRAVEAELHRVEIALRTAEAALRKSEADARRIEAEARVSKMREDLIRATARLKLLTGG
jgi:hypothetical protein